MRNRTYSVRHIKVVGIVAVLALSVGCGTDTSGQQPGETTVGATGETDTTTSQVAGVEETSDNNPELTSIRFAAPPPDFAQLDLFKFQEYMEDGGVDVEFVHFEDDNTLTRALLAGEVEYASGALFPVIQLASQVGSEGQVLRILSNGFRNTDYLLVAQGDIGGLEEFIGADLTMGISVPGDLSDTLTRSMFQGAGYDDSEVNFVQVGGTSARMTAILNGELDAGPAHAADAIAATRLADNVQILERYADHIPPYLHGSSFASEETIMQNPILTQLVVDSLIEAIRWASENKDGYIAVANRELADQDLSEDVMSDAYDIYEEVGMWALDGGISVEGLEQAVQIEVATGAISEGDVVPVEQWTDASFVEDYLERHGSKE